MKKSRFQLSCLGQGYLGTTLELEGECLVAALKDRVQCHSDWGEGSGSPIPSFQS